MVGGFVEVCSLFQIFMCNTVSDIWTKDLKIIQNRHQVHVCVLSMGLGCYNVTLCNTDSMLNIADSEQHISML